MAGMGLWMVEQQLVEDAVLMPTVVEVTAQLRYLSSNRSIMLHLLPQPCTLAATLSLHLLVMDHLELFILNSSSSRLLLHHVAACH
jgi:vesicle coat complex subunit